MLLPICVLFLHLQNAFCKCTSLIRHIFERIAVFNFDEVEQLSFTQFYKIALIFFSINQPIFTVPVANQNSICVHEISLNTQHTANL